MSFDEEQPDFYWSVGTRGRDELQIKLTFQSPRGTTLPKIIGPKRNVNLICNSSLYTCIPKIKSISPNIAKKSGDN